MPSLNNFKGFFGIPVHRQLRSSMLYHFPSDPVRAHAWLSLQGSLNRGQLDHAVLCDLLKTAWQNWGSSWTE